MRNYQEWSCQESIVHVHKLAFVKKKMVVDDHYQLNVMIFVFTDLSVESGKEAVNAILPTGHSAMAVEEDKKPDTPPSPEPDGQPEEGECTVVDGNNSCYALCIVLVL